MRPAPPKPDTPNTGQIDKYVVRAPVVPKKPLVFAAGGFAGAVLLDVAVRLFA